jgi:hypothetical protein
VDAVSGLISPSFTPGANTDRLDVVVRSGSWSDNGTNRILLGNGDQPIYYLGSELEVRNVRNPYPSVGERFVDAANLDLLGVRLTDGDRTSAAAGMTTASARTSRARSLIDSAAGRARTVRRAFQAFLRRSPDTGGLAYWSGKLAEGQSVRSMRQNLVGSAEYYSDAGGTDGQYITQAYADILNRAPDSAGFAYWSDQLERGVPLAAVSSALLISVEARSTLVAFEFRWWLGRNPTTSERDFWREVLRTQAAGEQLMVSTLVGGDAYVGLVPAP